jgi:hypothetical protein
MIVRPTESITGKMVSTGNVILKNNPPIVDVQQLYHGRVIYNYNYSLVISLKIVSKFLFF